MERRHFLKFVFGAAAGAAALAVSAQAAPLAPYPLVQDGSLPAAREDVHPAVTTTDEVEQLKPEQVRWGHRGHGHWHRHRRHWWHRHRWHRHHRHW
ncbi:MAG: twin-arginine translocation signal domain-containing protein [Bryobacteraceae bacterium]|jgi:hypothetical protein